MAQHHPEWLAPRPAGFIPNLTDAFALMWIDRRLAQEGLDAATRAALEELRAKALKGQLTWREFQEFRARGRGSTAALQSMVRRLQSARAAAAQLAGVPEEALRCLETAVKRLQEALARGSARPRAAARRFRPRK